MSGKTRRSGKRNAERGRKQRSERGNLWICERFTTSRDWLACCFVVNISYHANWFEQMIDIEWLSSDGPHSISKLRTCSNIFISFHVDGIVQHVSKAVTTRADSECHRTANPETEKWFEFHLLHFFFRSRSMIVFMRNQNKNLYRQSLRLEKSSRDFCSESKTKITCLPLGDFYFHSSKSNYTYFSFIHNKIAAAILACSLFNKVCDVS